MFDDVFKALADPGRRLLLDKLHADNGQTLGHLCKHLEMSRQAVTKHLNILEAANLVAVTWQGREKLHWLNPVPLQEIYDRWIEKFERGRLRALSNLKKALKQIPSRNIKRFLFFHHHEIKIRQARLRLRHLYQYDPKKLWAALTDPKLIPQYWLGRTCTTTWKRGDTLETRDPDGDVEWTGKIVESRPPHRLAYTFQMPGENQPLTKVSFDIEKMEKDSVLYGRGLKLTVTHVGYEPGTKPYNGISWGWPVIVSGLKSLLETGHVTSPLK